MNIVTFPANIVTRLSLKNCFTNLKNGLRLIIRYDIFFLQSLKNVMIQS